MFAAGAFLSQPAWPSAHTSPHLARGKIPSPPMATSRLSTCLSWSNGLQIALSGFLLPRKNIESLSQK